MIQIPAVKLRLPGINCKQGLLCRKLLGLVEEFRPKTEIPGPLSLAGVLAWSIHCERVQGLYPRNSLLSCVCKFDAASRLWLHMLKRISREFQVARKALLELIKNRAIILDALLSGLSQWSLES